MPTKYLVYSDFDGEREYLGPGRSESGWVKKAFAKRYDSEEEAEDARKKFDADGVESVEE